MPDYRRAQVLGGTLFITVVTYNRIPLFQNSRVRELLHNAWVDVEQRFPFSTEAICLLPDHSHFLMTLPEDEENFSIRIREIKRLFTRSYLDAFGMDGPRSQSRLNKNEAAIWQRRFYEHTIRDERDLKTHIDYIHFNPVKHGFVAQVNEWRWSSFHRFVKNGYYPVNWGEGIIFSEEQQEFGE